MSENFRDARRQLECLLGAGTIGDISLPYGWIGLFEAFAIYMKALSQEVRSGVSIQQIKEKYGTLRIYCYAPDEVFDLVGAAELASNAVCGICGHAGCMRESGWIGVRCDIHAQDQPGRSRRVAASTRQTELAVQMLRDVWGQELGREGLEAIARIHIVPI
ncbi:hypothetical protein [Ferrovibrio terrae]|uniref:hypothetical protein n=1 Tax=Ferrovibrio terrae TaxID=2594003 RepID=UPI0031381BE1